MTPTTTETTGTWLRLTATHVSEITSKILYMNNYHGYSYWHRTNLEKFMDMMNEMAERLNRVMGI